MSYEDILTHHYGLVKEIETLSPNVIKALESAITRSALQNYIDNIINMMNYLKSLFQRPLNIVAVHSNKNNMS